MSTQATPPRSARDVLLRRVQPPTLHRRRATQTDARAAANSLETRPSLADRPGATAVDTVSAAARDRPAPPYRGALIIDDEEALREAMADMLTLYDIEVHTAGDGAAGLALFRRHADVIGVIILDYSMPGLSAAETIRRLRAIRPSLPIILASGYTIGVASRELGTQTVSDFIQKPYDVDRLITLIKTHLNLV